MPVYNETNKSKWTKDGRHYYFRCYYTDFQGNRKQKVSKMYKSSSEAKNEERLYLNKVTTKDVVDYNVTFEHVYNEWLEYKRKQIKSTSFYTLKLKLNKHITCYLNNYRLHSIKLNTINEILNKKEFTECSQNYQNTIIGHLKELLCYARDNYDYDGKIVNKIQRQKIEVVTTTKTTQWNYWTYETFLKFISVVDIDKYHILFNFLYFTGLRIGEAIALSWSDFDFNKNQVIINKNFTNKLGENGYRIISPKTKNSIRIVDLDDNLIGLLKQYKTVCMNNFGFNDNWFTFGDVRPTPPTTIARQLNKYINISGVPKITPHGFRHSHVSLLINLGCDSRDVAERIGDTIQIVESTYYHMFPEKKSNTVNILNKIKR